MVDVGGFGHEGERDLVDEGGRLALDEVLDAELGGFVFQTEVHGDDFHLYLKLKRLSNLNFKSILFIVFKYIY